MSRLEGKNVVDGARKTGTVPWDNHHAHHRFAHRVQKLAPCGRGSRVVIHTRAAASGLAVFVEERA